MPNYKTNIVFLWHMHQPYYKSPDKNYYLLPWVRLHGVKDYYGMARTLEKFPNVKSTFNFSGILLDQLQDYVNNNAQDYYGILSLKEVADLTKEERKFILNRFFSVNIEHYIKPNARYLALYNKKDTPADFFSNQEITDLQVLFNLAWFHPYTIKEDKRIQEISFKKGNYSKDDKEYVIRKHYSILKEILPLYKKLFQRGQIELTISPYHHPILPLIYDTDVIREFPSLRKPLLRFSWPQDARWHIQKAQDVFKGIFDAPALGSWPSEGSVSEDIIALYKSEGIRWLATDEAILFKSLTSEYVSFEMIQKHKSLIYQPYSFQGVNFLFRDRTLSDAISFIYQAWDDTVSAAYALLDQLEKASNDSQEFLEQPVITIIMDGENAWEYYKNNGVDFLETVYSELEKNKKFITSTPSQVFKTIQTKKLERVMSGSWINADFKVWIGTEKNNLYWTALRKMRDLIDNADISKKEKERLREYLYTIEGSDWYWWNTFVDTSGDFAKIFLSYVENIYKSLGKCIPASILLLKDK